MWIPDEALELFDEGATTDDIVRQKILNAYGVPASSRTARRWRKYWRQLRNNPESVVEEKISERHPRAAVRKQAARVHFDGAVFDIETTDFSTAGMLGHLVCACILPLNSDDTITIKLEYKDQEDDRRILRELIKALNQYDFLIGHNIAAFDLNWLDSRRMYYGWKPLRTWHYFDTLNTAKALAIKAGSKRLGWLSDYFGLEGEKTAIYPASWHQVRSRDRAQFEHRMGDIVYHCQQDVLMNRNLFDVLFPESLTLRNSQIKQTRWATGRG